jgi:hypothetical protein
MSWQNKNLRCRNCKFWWPVAEGSNEPSHDHSTHGQCRRHAPPAAVHDSAEQTRSYPGWATTKRDDWCGEHSHVEM